MLSITVPVRDDRIRPDDNLGLLIFRLKHTLGIKG